MSLRERVSLYCVSPPGEAAWVTDLHYLLTGAALHCVPKPPALCLDGAVLQALDLVLGHVVLRVKHVLDHAPELDQLPVAERVVCGGVEGGHPGHCPWLGQ